MNYIEEVEKVLSNYRHLESSIEHLSNRLRRLNISNTSGNLVANYDVTGIRKNFAPADAIDQLCEYKMLRDERELTRQKIQEIDEILEDISKGPGCEYYGLVLRRCCIDKIKKEQVAEEIGYSQRQSIYDIKKAALNAFTIQWFGISALKVI